MWVNTRFVLFPFRSPLLREYKHLLTLRPLSPLEFQRNSAELRGHMQNKRYSLFSFPLATKMFQFARLSFHQDGIIVSYNNRVSPFGNLRINGCSAPSRSLSQPATSFIVVYCQGIHHILLTVYDTLFIKDKRRYHLKWAVLDTSLSLCLLSTL